ncbi:MAG: methyl-accepting chemotaxis protein, partial [Succinivibrio sp.]
KGFAVVADEVRALASRTGASTQQITKMVAQIQQDARSANDSMGQSLENMNGLAKRADSVKDLLSGIIDGVEKVHGQITQIATAAEEQTTATSEISSNMQNITAACKSFAEEVEETERQISGSVAKMDELNDLVSSLKA